jgi:hypothetical protein
MHSLALIICRVVQVRESCGPLAERALRSLAPLIRGTVDDAAGCDLAQPRGMLAGLCSVPVNSNGALVHSCAQPEDCTAFHVGRTMLLAVVMLLQVSSHSVNDAEACGMATPHTFVQCTHTCCICSESLTSTLCLQLHHCPGWILKSSPRSLRWFVPCSSSYKCCCKATRRALQMTLERCCKAILAGT